MSTTIEFKLQASFKKESFSELTIVHRHCSTAHIKDFLQSYKAVLTDADVDQSSMEVDGYNAPRLKYQEQLVCRERPETREQRHWHLLYGRGHLLPAILDSSFY